LVGLCTRYVVAEDAENMIMGHYYSW